MRGKGRRGGRPDFSQMSPAELERAKEFMRARGMTDEQMAHIFQPFQQADASISAKYGGTGLGLSITRRIMEMLGGSVSVTSTPGKGTAFVLELPLRAPGAPTAVTAGREAKRAKSMPPAERVLETAAEPG